MSELSWDIVKADIARANKPLYEILQTIDGIQNMLFTVHEYKYGQIIADENYFYLPNDEGKLDSVPFSMVLDKNLEMFIEFKGKYSTHHIYKEGELFNVSSFYHSSNTHHPSDILQIASGARNTFLLCPIADARPHNRLEKYFNTTLPMPTDLGDHYLTFKKLCEAGNCDWRSKLLVFPNQIVKLIKEGKVPSLFKLIMEFASNQTSYDANVQFYNYLLNYIRSNNSEISQNDFTNDTVNQLITIGTGQVPGYGLAVNDDLLPLHFISEAYRDIYKSKYIPLIMVPTHFDKKTNCPVFYSILKEERAFKPTSFSNKPQRCELIYNTYAQYSAQIKALGYFTNTPFYQSATRVNITMFNEKKSQISNDLFKLPRETIFDYDPRFLDITEKLGYSRNDFPSKTSFLVGCFGIKFDENDNIILRRSY